MPYRRKNKRRYRRRRRIRPRYRRYRRRPKRARINTLILRQPSFFPDAFICRLKYTKSFSLSGSGTNLQEFAGNGLFTPDLTTPTDSHQPLGFDTYSLLYDKYYVSGCSIFLTLQNTGQTSVQACILPTADNLVIADINSYVENPYSKNTILSFVTGNSQTKYLKMFVKTKAMFGRLTKDDVIYHANAGSSGGSNPTNIWRFQIITSELFGGTSGTACTVNLVYHCKFYERRNDAGD